ncbi:shieldin complex subunit 1 isoform X2 [Struthio camelus]|uniref:shieldin complex subunit 1 isoform X2 n=1 Tax=Struthio camelus TaxID=8801 RepID=UPI003604219C
MRKERNTDVCNFKDNNVTCFANPDILCEKSRTKADKILKVGKQVKDKVLAETSVEVVGYGMSPAQWRRRERATICSSWGLFC